tara:strand:+ start:778 stop:1458 length:681 start_codon:yes stop_codon:yes gene_type:complete
MQNKIEFILCNKSLENAIPYPKPASHFIPEQYKKLEKLKNGDVNRATIKSCIPFLDALTFGYIIPFHQDYLIDAKENDFTVSASIPREVMEYHDKEQLTEEMSNGKQKAGKFKSEWIVVTPPGYSCLFIAPLNRKEERFQILSGVVDTDTYHNTTNIPFLNNRWNQQTLIKQGEPMVQVIPFKREPWKMKTGFRWFQDEHTLAIHKLLTSMVDKYKNKFWRKKSYK